MKVYAIGDLHLSGHTPTKPMNVFGEKWNDHWNRIKEDWIHKVGDQDIVLIPGDISWAMNLDEAKPDLEEIGKLPGRIVLLKGNHDYWWSSLNKVRRILTPRMTALQNDCYPTDGLAICGTRGWICPNENRFTSHDQKIYERELQRLELSLKAGKRTGDDDIIVMMHFPPFNDRMDPSGFTDLFQKYGVKKVVYAHLHGGSLRNVVEGFFEDIEYHLVSCDYLDFSLKLIHQVDV